MARLQTLGGAILAGSCLFAASAQAQIGNGGGAQPFTGGILPQLGTDTRIGDLRPQLQSYFDAQAAPRITTPAWIVTPSIGVDVGATDNALRTSTRQRADVFTTLTPGLAIIGDTPRLKVNLFYSPQITVYASSPSQNQINQALDAQARGIIVPDALFIDARGSISTTSLSGNGLSQYQTAAYNRQDTVQTTSFSVTPYAEHRFGSDGTGRIGYSLARTMQDTQASQGQINQLNQNQFNQNGLQNNQTTAINNFVTPGYGALGNLTTQRERGSFTSGENLGRFNSFTVAEAIQYMGNGVYSGAYRNQLEEEIGFALTRRITLLAGVGYQDIRYGGTPVIRVNEPSWNFGARYSPNPDSTITALYGRHDGITSISFDGQYAPTARTRIIGRYSTGITSDIEEAQSVLDSTTVGPTGLVTDTATGAPVGGSSSGIDNGIYKLKRLSIEALLLQERDTYSASITTEDRTALSNSSASYLGNGFVPAGTTTNSVYASVNWQHDLAPGLNSVLLGSYGITSSSSNVLVGNSGQQRTFSISAALNKQFTETLSGSVRYIFNDQSGGRVGSGFGGNNGSYTSNIVLVGFRKSF